MPSRWNERRNLNCEAAEADIVVIDGVFCIEPDAADWAANSEARRCPQSRYASQKPEAKCARIY